MQTNNFIIESKKYTNKFTVEYFKTSKYTVYLEKRQITMITSLAVKKIAVLIIKIEHVKKKWVSLVNYSQLKQ